MLNKVVAIHVGLMGLMAVGNAQAESKIAVAPPSVGPTAIGGTVSGAAGPEAGVWVIAETSDLPSRFAKIVVTDDQGRFVLPDLPKAKYKVWSRGYGLADSRSVDASRGQIVQLKNFRAASASEAAQIYPANYWSSLLRVPAASEFPGTGPTGNGISPAFKIQQDWIVHLMENCEVCHQIGTKATRELAESGDPVEAWNQRIRKDRNPDAPFYEAKIPVERGFAARMDSLMTLYGRHRGLEMFADWTTRISKGETPPAPPRPTGVERNVVLTLWEMGGGRFFHDSVSTDKRNPTVNAGGSLYGSATFTAMLVALDPKTAQEQQYKLRNMKGERWEAANNHTPMMDAKGRIWMTNIGTLTATLRNRPYQGPNPSYCTDVNNRFAKYFPRVADETQVISMFDPITKTDQVLPVCFGTHHLNFDNSNRLYFSGDTEVVGWLDTDVWDKSKDISKAIGWCPFVLDTNGDGKITADRSQWNQRLDGIGGGEGASVTFKGTGKSDGLPDPNKDTRIAGFTYGLGISPKDQSFWAAKFSPYIPSGIIRVETGAHPPETCKTEYFEAPKVDGQYRAYNARGVDVDADGVAWVAFGSGMIGRFDRSKCKVLTGPTATGQHCPEGWELISTPGPKFKGTNVSSDWSYLVFVDHHNTLGLGHEVPIIPNSSGDELLAYLPKTKQFVHLRVPYPLSFYARSLDGRIDDQKGGWKGRGLWATNNTIPIWHTEWGEGSAEVAAHFQIRPNPLAQ
jgi:hypothetical protein